MSPIRYNGIIWGTDTVEYVTERLTLGAEAIRGRSGNLNSYELTSLSLSLSHSLSLTHSLTHSHPPSLCLALHRKLKVRDYVVAEHSPSKVDFIGINSPGRDNGRQQCVHHCGGTGHSHVLPLACLGTICPGHASIKAPDLNYIPLF